MPKTKWVESAAWAGLAGRDPKETHKFMGLVRFHHLIRKNAAGKKTINWEDAEKLIKERPIRKAKETSAEKRREYHRKAKLAEKGIDTTTTEKVASGLDFLDEKRKYSAKNEELKYRKALGELVNSDAVKQESFETARLMRDSLLALPDRLAGQLAGTDSQDECYDILTREINRVCTDLADRIEALDFADVVVAEDSEDESDE